MFANVNQLSDLPCNANRFDTSISSQGLSSSLFSIKNSWTGIDNGKISSIESSPTDTTDEPEDFQWTGS